MADTNYGNQNIYHKQEGDELYVADGGQITVEDGGEIEIESGGELEVLSGGTLDIQSGANFYLAGDTNAFSVDKLNYMLLSFNTKTAPWGESGTTVSGASVMTPAYGYHILSLTTGLSLGSWQLPTANLGARIHIDGSGLVGDANVVLYASGTAGVSVPCVDTASTLLSSINLSAAAVIDLVCFNAGTWAIVEHNANATPKAIA